MSDVLTTVFLVGSVVLLVLLWRRGPSRRRAFFGVGLLVAVAAFAASFAFDELDRRGVVLPGVTLDELALPELSLTGSSTGPAPAAVADRVREWIGEPTEGSAEETLALIPRTQATGCVQRTDVMRPAAAVIECDHVFGNDTVLRIGLFEPPQRPRAWFRKRASNAVALPADDADASCRLGEPAAGIYRHGDFICWQQGSAARVGWIDPERRLAGVLASTSLDLGEVYRRWRDGEAGQASGASVAP